MEPQNHTEVSEFLLLGLTEDPEVQIILFELFLSVYLVTVLANLLIILAISSDPHLHTPMYYFLCNLSFTDICISAATIPMMVVNIQAQNQHISFTGCIIQVYFFFVFAGFETFILATMAYDRYVAICHLLRYTYVMTPRLCVLLILLSLLITSGVSVLHSLMVLRLSFCRDQEIPHFFCDLAQVIKLPCSDTLINNLLIYFVGSLLGGVPVSGIMFSYTKILSSILRMTSVEGFGMYISPAVPDSFRTATVASMMYIVVPQVMNPFIYSLRNRDM
ncbi:olfactory receptor 7G2-like [Manis pentadactyla]|uniref:olfactory receptor 7G2-like n=1 Tax=Manis pentadactyla TaxID=143292 RepID=UPI00255CEEE2|nr:olfactory receptor 7G2-like [Manis pentadactyla]